MAQWKHLSEEVLELNGNNFIEVGVRQPPEGERKFLAIAKGWKTEEGEKRFKSNVVLPVEQGEELIELIKKVLK